MVDGCSSWGGCSELGSVILTADLFSGPGAISYSTVAISCCFGSGEYVNNFDSTFKVCFALLRFLDFIFGITRVSTVTILG